MLKLISLAAHQIMKRIVIFKETRGYLDKRCYEIRREISYGIKIISKIG